MMRSKEIDESQINVLCKSTRTNLSGNRKMLIKHKLAEMISLMEKNKHHGSVDVMTS